MGPARYEKIDVQAFRTAMDRCVSDPGQRSARAVLRLTREQLLARPGGAYRSATPMLLTLAVGALLGSAWAFTGKDMIAEKLRNAGMGGGFLLVAILAVAVLFQGRRLAGVEHEDRDEVLSLAKAAWAKLSDFEPEPDPVYKDTLRELRS